MNIDTLKAFRNESFKIKSGQYEIKIIQIAFRPPSPNWVEKKHYHMTYELHIIPKGHGSLTIEKTSYAIAPGTVYLTGPQIRHSQNTNPIDPMAEYCIEFEIVSPKHTKESSFITQDMPKTNEFCEILANNSFWFGTDKFGCAEIMEKIYDELTQKNFSYNYYVQSLLSQVIISFTRNIYNHYQLDSLSSKTIEERREEILDSYFQFHSDETMSIDSLATDLFISKRQLYRIVQKRYGMTFKEKLNHMRVENSKTLLEETDASMSEVALAVGFSSANYFIRIFKSIEGITPLEYRKIAKLNSDSN